MTGLEQMLRRLIAALEAARIPFMLTGSLASTAYGAPRSTYDIDLVVDPPDAMALEVFLAALGDAVYADADAAREAWRLRSMFNVVDAAGWKADLILRQDRAFSREEFARRRRLVLLGLELPAASAEDVILSKLEWSRRAGGSERQRRDAAAVFAAAGPGLDRAYLQRWVQALHLEAEWAWVAGGTSPGQIEPGH